jgi:hypothetical protein
MKKYGMIAVGLVLGVVGLVQAGSFRQLLTEEKAALGATHVAVINYADFAGSTTTNTAGTVTFTNAVPANASLMGVWYDLPQPFAYGYDGAAITNGMTNATMYAGVPSALSNLLHNVEMGSATTPVYAKWGQGPNAGISFNSVATTSVVVTVSGNWAGAMSQLTNGQARIYVRILTRSTQLD